MNESDLIARAAGGDTAAFGVLVRQNQSQLRGFLRRITRADHALADDLAQETFLEAWRKLSQFRGEGSFAGWLSRIAWSRFLMEARKRKPELLEDLPEQSFEKSPDGKLDLERAMGRISVAERAALTLCYALGHSNEEAAAILDMPLGTVKSHILRGREKLRAVLESGSMTDDLDTQLSQPLPSVADDGFSLAAASRALALNERRKLLDQLVLLAVAGVVLAALPLTLIEAAIETVTVGLGSLLPVTIAFAALVLTASFARLVVDRPE